MTMTWMIPILLFTLTVVATAISKQLPVVDYDVIIIGGGPAGLSALSALSRVNRTAILFDSGEYRNAKTRHIHDVIGYDGVLPAVLREAARKQILRYSSGEIKDVRILSLKHIQDSDYDVLTARDDSNATTTGRSIILATGVTDVLPTTPGVLDAFGRGMYWCPWCYGYEHRNQSLGIVGPLSKALDAILEVHNLNTDVVLLTNGTDTLEQRVILNKQYPRWQEQSKSYNIRVINTTISAIERLRRGDSSHRKEGLRAKQLQQKLAESDGPSPYEHCDLFRVDFVDGPAIERAAFLINTQVKQTSTLPRLLRVVENDNMKIEVDPKMRTVHPSKKVFAVGDANNDGSTNIPHALFSGKRAAVVAHSKYLALAMEDSIDSISKRSSNAQTEQYAMWLASDDLESLWRDIQRSHA